MFLPTFEDGFDFRHFDSKIEAQAAVWGNNAFDSNDWRELNYKYRWMPSSLIPDSWAWVTNNQIICLMKKTGCLSDNLDDEESFEALAKEKIVCDLALKLGVAVAPGTLWWPKERSEEIPYFISLPPFPLASENTYERYVYPNRIIGENSGKAHIERLILSQVVSINSILWAFHIWIGDQEEHSSLDNMVISLNNKNNSGIKIAAIDHGYAKMKFIEPGSNYSVIEGEELWPFSGVNSWRTKSKNKLWRPPIDSKAVRVFLKRLSGLSDQTIKETIFRVPSCLISQSRKEEFFDGLISSRQKTISWMRYRLKSVRELSVEMERARRFDIPSNKAKTYLLGSQINKPAP